MTHSTIVAVKQVEKMKKGKGIDPITDKLKRVLLIDVNFDGNAKLELTSDDKNCIAIAEEWIEQKYEGKESDPTIDIQDSEVVWTFSERASSTLRQLYKKEVESVDTLSEHAARGTANQIVISCTHQAVPDIRPRVKDLMKKNKDSKQATIKVRGKNEKAKKFCETYNEESFNIIYDDKNKHIVVTGKTQDVISGVKSKWKEYDKQPKSEKAENTTTTKNKEKAEKIPGTNDLEAKGSEELTSNIRAGVEEQRPDKSSETSDPEEKRFKHAETSKSTRDGEETKKPPYKNIYPDLTPLEGSASAYIPIGAMGLHNVVGPGTQEEKKYVFQVGRIKVLIYKMSIVDIQKMDAVVNAANDYLAHAGGVAYFISKAAGKSMDDECNQYIKKHGQLDVSDVFVSKPGKMKCKGIFHAVGPRWSEYIGSEDKCAEDLYNTVFKCLECMDERKWRNIALCAISSGIFGVPKELCTAMYLKAIEDFAVKKPKRELDIHFIDVNTEILDLLTKTHKDRLTSGQSPGFGMALKFPSAKKGYTSKGWGGLNVQASTRPREGERGLAAGGAAYKHGYGHAALPDAAPVKWEEHRPEMVQGAVVDIEQYFKGTGKLSTEKGQVKDLKVQDISEGKCTYCKNKASKKLPCKHIYCDTCYVNSKDACRKCKANNKDKTPVGKTKEDVGKKMQECSICCEEREELATLKCGHQFCRDCFERTVAEKPSCCGIVFGIITGTQPDGQMFYKFVNEALPGYDMDSTIEILYRFQNGKQKKCHPSPGRLYQGMERRAFLPDNVEGRHVLELLKKAWSRRLIFTIGDSVTTGQTGVITWNDIHHKTKPSGGQFGYPDPTYLQRVQEELAAKGVTD